MTLLEFVGDHPIVTILIAMIVCNTVVDIVRLMTQTVEQKHHED
jgi:hypothetical protein